MLTLGFIGTGNMGGALAQAAAKNDNNRLLLANRHPEKAQRLREKIGGELTDSRSAAAMADYIFLGVKPQMLETLFAEIRDTLSARTDRFVLVSMAAGTSIEKVQRLAGGDYPVIRIMPNTPVSIGEGMILYACSKELRQEEKNAFLEAMAAAGRFSPLEEKLIDAGSARLILESGRHPGELKDAVCSPGGTTIQGVRALEEAGFRAAVMNAVIAAYEKNFKL